MVINLIMVGGQVLIIFVGGEAFKVVPLNGKEWGLSVGLGAISLPWGAAIRMFPDMWICRHVPAVRAQMVVSRASAPELEEARRDREDKDLKPPLRIMSGLRGQRARKNIRRSLKEHLHDAKANVKKAKRTLKGQHADHKANGGEK